jgi:hypothetical protein
MCTYNQSNILINQTKWNIQRGLPVPVVTVTAGTADFANEVNFEPLVFMKSHFRETDNKFALSFTVIVGKRE